MITNDKVTLVVPTFNRSHFMERCLSYLVSDANPFQVFIADGSGEDHAKKNASLCERFADDLDLRYFHFPPACSVHKRFLSVVEQVRTPFLQVLADDDFLVCSGITAAAQTLAGNPDTVAAQGALLSVRRLEDTFIIRPGTFAVLSHESPAARLRDHLHVYRPTFYATFQTGAFTRALRLAGVFSDLPFRFQELALSALCVLQGKTAQVNALHGARIVHSESFGKKDIGWGTMMRQEGFAQATAQFVEVIGGELAAREGCSKRRAGRIVEEAFADYLTRTSKSRVLPEFVAGSAYLKSIFSGEQQDARESLNQALRLLA